MLEFDPKLTLGNVIEIAVILGGGLMALGAFKSRVDVLTVELNHIKEKVGDVGQMLRTVAVQDERIARLEQDLYGLKRGEGWIVLPPSRAAT